jgi:hypothetical protein
MGLRFYLGAAVLVGAEAGWLLVPFASVSGWNTPQIASLSEGCLSQEHQIASQNNH